MDAQFHLWNSSRFVYIAFAFIDLVITRTFRRVKVLTASNKFLRRLRDRQLSLTTEIISSRIHRVVLLTGIGVFQGAC